MNQIDMLMNYHGNDTMLECYQRYIPKLINIARLKKNCFVDVME